MQVLHLVPGHQAVPTTAPADAAGGYYWVDLDSADPDREARLQRWLGVEVDEHQLLRSTHGGHLPFYDGTDAYDLLVLRTLDTTAPAQAPAMRPLAVFVTDRTLISIRPQGDRIFERLQQRLLAGMRKAPDSVGGLLALLINQIVEQLLDWRATVADLISDWQDRLLSHDGTFTDWESLTRLRCNLRRLESVSDDQLDAIGAWREQTDLPLDDRTSSRLDELRRELSRVFDHAALMQSDLDSLLQTHYAAVGQRTNETLRFLTVISTVFLPLNLIAGIFGMNFIHIPFLQDPLAPFVTLGAMTLLGIGLLWLSRKKRLI